jgi:hypothetical protein
MLIGKDNQCRTIGWRETYVSANEIVNVSVGGKSARFRHRTELPVRWSPRHSLVGSRHLH